MNITCNQKFQQPTICHTHVFKRCFVENCPFDHVLADEKREKIIPKPKDLQFDRVCRHVADPKANGECKFGLRCKFYHPLTFDNQKRQALLALVKEGLRKLLGIKSSNLIKFATANLGSLSKHQRYHHAIICRVGRVLA